jgi:hypothetical protein
MFYTSKGGVPGVNHNDVNYEVVLRNCNGKLTQWMNTWQREMEKGMPFIWLTVQVLTLTCCTGGGESFHFSFLSFFRLYVRLFLNSFGIQASMSPVCVVCPSLFPHFLTLLQTSRSSPSLQALSACCTSAIESLQIVSKEFASMSMLVCRTILAPIASIHSHFVVALWPGLNHRHVSILRHLFVEGTIVILSQGVSFTRHLQLLRSSNTLTQLHEGTTHEIHSVISKTADAYHNASVLSPASTSAAYHARFLRSLVATDIFKARRNEKERYDTGMPIDPRLQGQIHPFSMMGPPAADVHSRSARFPWLGSNVPIPNVPASSDASS